MVGRWLATTAALLALGAAPARADVASDAQAVAAACGREGGFGIRFGQAEAELGPTRPSVSSAVFVTPAGDWRPFARFEAALTYHGRQVHTLAGSAPYRSGEDAAQVLATAAARLEAAGLKRLDTRRNGKMADFISPDAEKGDGGYWVQMSAGAKSLTLQCGDRALIQLGTDEFQGRAPIPERPAPPTFAPPPVPAADACDTAPARAETVAAFRSVFPLAARFSQDAARHAERLSQWRGQQLVKAKAWSVGQEEAFRRALAADPAWLDLFKAASLALLRGFRASDAVEAQADEAGQCRASLDGLAAVSDLHAAVLARWALVETRYDAEAKRLGAP